MHFKAKGPERVTKKRVFQQRISNDSKWVTDLHLFSVLKEASNVSSTLSKPWLFPTGAIKNIRVLDTFRSRQMAKVEFIEDKECPLFSNQVIWSFNLFVPIFHWLSTNNALFMRIIEYHASCCKYSVDVQRCHFRSKQSEKQWQRALSISTIAGEWLRKRSLLVTARCPHERNCVIWLFQRMVQ